MKTFIIAMVMFFYSQAVFAITWYKPVQDTVQWDTVVSAAGRSVTYRAYLAPHGDKVAKSLLGEVTATTYVITFPSSGGSFVFGVSAVYDSGLTTEEESAINWGDTTDNANPEAFGWDIVMTPQALRRKTS